MTFYFVHIVRRAACKLHVESLDWFAASFREEMLRDGYVECGWWRYQWYKWWKAR